MPSATESDFFIDAATDTDDHGLASPTADCLQPQPRPIFGEDTAAYREHLRRIAIDVAPRDIVETMWLEDMAALTIESEFYRQAKKSVLRQVVPSGAIPAMSSERRLAANRANARRSTGPRTASGKANSRLNAVRHGLSTPPDALPEFALETARLTQAIAGNGKGDPRVWEAAARLAAAAVDVARIRRLRAEVLERIQREPVSAPLPRRDDGPKERNPRAKPNAAPVQGCLDDRVGEMVDAIMAGFRPEIKIELQKTAETAAKARIRDSHRQRAADWRLLETLERYERRALSRRATAISALDDALAARAQP